MIVRHPADISQTLEDAILPVMDIDLYNQELEAEEKDSAGDKQEILRSVVQFSRIVPMRLPTLVTKSPNSSVLVLICFSSTSRSFAARPFSSDPSERRDHFS
jgi:hypothetical protein